MGSAVEQNGVLAAGRLALTAVHHDDGPHPAPDGGLGHGTQLLPEGESRAASAAQGYLLGELGEPLAGHRFQRSVHLEVHLEIEALDQVEPLGQLGKADDADLGDIGEGAFKVGLLRARSRALRPEAERAVRASLGFRRTWWDYRCRTGRELLRTGTWRAGRREGSRRSGW